MYKNIQEALTTEAKQIGVKITNEQVAMFLRYMEMLLDWNQKVNLTAITDPDEIVVKHFIDSISLLSFATLKENSSMIDVGCGAGFPSLPIKILRPDIKLTLLDGSKKRLNFLDEVASELNLEVTTLHKRAEEAGRDKEYRESFDYAVSRAVANMNVLSEYSIPLIKMKGHFFAFKGPSADEELKESKGAIKELGGEVKEIYELELTGEQKRKIVDIQKLDFTPKQYPRHGNTIIKHPMH